MKKINTNNSDSPLVPCASCQVPSSIIFDWGGVLIDSPAPEIMAHCSATLGVSIETFTDAYRHVEFDFYRGQISEPRFWQEICSSIGIAAPREYSEGQDSLWLRAFSTAYRPKMKMFELISRLKNSGYRIGLLSNVEMPILKYFEKGMYGDFDFSVFSCVEAMAKPDAEIYHLTAKKAQTNPENCLFIDDRKENTLAAEAIGMKAIQFDTVEDCEEKINNFCPMPCV